MSRTPWASLLLAGALLAGCASSPSSRARAVSPEEVLAGRRARNWLERDLPGVMAEAEVPGMSVALIEGGKVSWMRGFGVKNTTTGEQVSEYTAFEAASLSKPVFAYAVMRLVDQGTLDLDAPLSRYLPGDRAPSDERLRKITARQVLSHTSGLPNWRPAGKPLVAHFEPGERFSYSGEGFVYLQEVVERLAGEPLDAFMRRTVFEPLDMRNSSYVWLGRYENQSAYEHDAAARVMGRPRSPKANAAASLMTTAEDYARFVAAMLQGTGLQEATWREMLRPQVAVSQGCTVCIERDPGAPSPVLAWGLGWGLLNEGSRRMFWHWGDNGGAKAYVAADLVTKRGVVVFANGANGLSLMRDLLAQVMGGEQPALAWLDYEQYDAPMRRLLRDVLARGTPAFTADRERRAKEGAPLSESQVNQLGYGLLAHGRAREAVDILRRNAEDFPASGNTHDSLGEALLAAGEKEWARQEYRKALELSPDNGNAEAVLRWLQVSQERRLSPEALDRYTGFFETPLGPVNILTEGTRLMFLFDSRPAKDLASLSDTRFLVEPGAWEVEFTLGEGGRATRVALLREGQRYEGTRTAP